MAYSLLSIPGRDKDKNIYYISLALKINMLKSCSWTTINCLHICRNKNAHVAVYTTFDHLGLFGHLPHPPDNIFISSTTAPPSPQVLLKGQHCGPRIGKPVWYQICSECQCELSTIPSLCLVSRVPHASIGEGWWGTLKFAVVSSKPQSLSRTHIGVQSWGLLD